MSKEKKLRKGKECVSCINVIKCKGHLGDLCVNYQKRESDPERKEKCYVDTNS